MENIIDVLFNYELSKKMNLTKEQKDVLDKLSNFHKYLTENLSDEQKEIYENFNELSENYSYDMSKYYFEKGLKAGVEMVLELFLIKK